MKYWDVQFRNLKICNSIQIKFDSESRNNLELTELSMYWGRNTSLELNFNDWFSSSNSLSFCSRFCSTFKALSVALTVLPTSDEEKS